MANARPAFVYLVPDEITHIRTEVQQVFLERLTRDKKHSPAHNARDFHLCGYGHGSLLGLAGCTHGAEWIVGNDCLTALAYELVGVAWGSHADGGIKCLEILLNLGVRRLSFP